MYSVGFISLPSRHTPVPLHHQCLKAYIMQSHSIIHYSWAFMSLQIYFGRSSKLHIFKESVSSQSIQMVQELIASHHSVSKLELCSKFKFCKQVLILNLGINYIPATWHGCVISLTLFSGSLLGLLLGICPSEENTLNLITGLRRVHLDKSLPVSD